MNRKILLFLLLTGALLQACTSSENTLESYFGLDIPIDSLDAHLQREVDRYNMPGLTIAFIEEGQVIHHRNFGYANVQEQIPVTDKTIFEAASLSKPVFAYFVMKYVEEGKLDLDKPLYTYLPYPDIAHDERYKQITARMVLCHRTGFPNWREDLPHDSLVIQFDPGTAYFYSGEGYQYLAKVLKEIDQTDWEGLEKAFQEKVAQPLGMEHTVYIQDDYSKANKAEAYDENGEWISPEKDVESAYRFQFRAPASIHSESLDFSKWLIGLMNREGLTEESFEELFAPHSYVGEFSSIDVDYTLGFFKPSLPGTNLYLHGGNNYGFTSFFALDPDKKWGFVLFTNSEYGEDLGNELLLLYMLFGPDLILVYLIVGVILLGLMFMMFLLVRSGVRRLRKKNG